MSYYSVDVEADGPTPGPYSMLSVGIVVVRDGLQDRFYQELRPISDRAVPEALEVSGLDREWLLVEGTDPSKAMRSLREFVDATSVGPAIFISDNPGFDFSFVNHYLHVFNQEAATTANPFGHSSRRIGDLWAGMQRDAGMASEWKRLRVTDHTHNALDDAVGNAEALLQFRSEGLAIDFH